MSKPIRQNQTAAGPMSPAQAELDALKRALNEAVRAVRTARAPVRRLRDEAAAPLAARTRLADFDRQEADAMAAWATAGKGPAPAPADGRADFTLELAQAERRGQAAQAALAAAETALAAAEAAEAAARARIRPAVADCLREQGRALAEDYWRRAAALEHVRRELAALDAMLAADFPTKDTTTGRPTLTWLSPDCQSAAECARAAAAAATDLPSPAALAQAWRTRAAELLG